MPFLLLLSRYIAMHHLLSGILERSQTVLTVTVNCSRQSLFAPADAPTRAANEAVQICWPGAALPLSPRSDQQPVPSPPRSRHCRRAQSFQDSDIPGLGANLQLRLAINPSAHCKSPASG